MPKGLIVLLILLTVITLVLWVLDAFSVRVFSG